MSGNRALIAALEANLPPQFVTHVERWLASNEKQSWEVKWGLFPLGMVGRWIERAEEAEAELTRLREALERVYQTGRGPHVGIAREALDA